MEHTIHLNRVRVFYQIGYLFGLGLSFVVVPEDKTITFSVCLGPFYFSIYTV